MCDIIIQYNNTVLVSSNFYRICFLQVNCICDNVYWLSICNGLNPLQ